LAIHREGGVEFHQFLKFSEEFRFRHNRASDHEINPRTPFGKGPRHEGDAGVKGACELMQIERLEGYSGLEAAEGGNSIRWGAARIIYRTCLIPGFGVRCGARPPRRPGARLVVAARSRPPRVFG